MQTAIVTGASSGIGLAISKMLLKRSIQVIGLARHFDSSAQCSGFIPIAVDLTETNKLCNIVNDIKKTYEISYLINNAGVGYFGPHEQLNPQKIHEMTALNLEAPMILSQLLLRDLKKNNGYIINISSVTAKKTNTHGCAYGATKAALSSFSASLFDEVRKYGVKVAAIHLDMVKSGFYNNSDFCEYDSQDSYITPEEAAQAIETVIAQRSSLILTDITIKPQLHKIQRKKI